MMRKLVALLALVLACSLSLASGTKQGVATTLYIDAKHSARWSAVLRLAGPNAEALSRSRQSPVLALRLPDSEAAAAIARIEKSGIKVLRQEKTLYGVRTRMSVRDMEAGKAEFAARGKRAPRYMDRYRDFVRMRAYPYDQIDFNKIEQERRRAELMPRFTMPPRRGERLPPTWTFVGPRNLDVPNRTFNGVPPLSGRVSAIAYDPLNPTTIFAGGPMGGVWKSTDAGVNWTPLSNSWPTQPVNCITFIDNQEIWVGLGDLHGGLNFGTGIRQSIDGGATWTTNAFTFNGQRVNHIMPVPGTNGNTVIVTTGNNPASFGGIWRTTDRGASFTRVENTANIVWTGLSIAPPDANGTIVIYAAASGTSPFRLYRSLDLGATWSGMTLPLPSGPANPKLSGDVAASKVNPWIVYYTSPQDKKILRSDDFGETWADITDGIPFGWPDWPEFNWIQPDYNYHIATSALRSADNTVWEEVLYAGNIDIAAWSPRFGTGAARWRSIGGPTWTEQATTHNDQHAFVIHPTDPYSMLMGNDGGLYRLVYDPATTQYTTTPLNRNLGLTQFYHISAHPTDPGNVIGGTQDNASPASRGDLLNWDNQTSGDGSITAINPLDGSVQYAQWGSLALFATQDNWQTNSFIQPDLTGDSAPFLAPIRHFKANTNLLAAATKFYREYDRSTNSWYKSDQDLSEGGTPSVIETTSDQNILYIGTETGAIWRSGNWGGGWVRIDLLGSSGTPARPIRDISADPEDPNSIIVVYGGATTSRVLQCTDTTASPPVYVNRSGTAPNQVPDVSTNSIARDPSAPSSRWWIANDVGVFVTQDSGASWLNATASLGLPSLIVNTICFGGGGEYLFAGTYGRGVWRLRVNPSPPRITSITAAPSTLVRQGQQKSTVTVTFQDKLIDPIVLDITSNNGVPSMTFPETISVPDEVTSATFEVGSENTTSTGSNVFTVTVRESGLSRQFTMTVRNPVVSSLEVVEPSVVGGELATGRIYIDAVAPPGGIPYQINSANTSIVLSTSGTVSAGFVDNQFNFFTGLTSVTRVVRQSVAGTSVFANVTVRPPRIKSLTFAKTDYGGGSGVPAQGRIELEGRAPAGGVTINLTSSVPSLLTVPATVTIPYNQRFALFNATHSATSTDRTVVVTGRHTVEGTQYSAQGFVVLRRSYVQSLTLSPQGVVGGQTSRATITLNAPAPANGLSIGLSASDRTNISMQNSIQIPAGVQTATFNIITRQPASDQQVVITAATNAESRSRTLNINRIGPFQVTATPNPMTSGGTATGRVRLNGPAPAGGLTISLLNGDLNMLNVPATVTVPEGATSAAFNILANTTTVRRLVNITALYKNSGASVTVVIDP